METIDIAIVVLGVVVLASAVAGALLYEPDAAGRSWDVDWATDSTSLDPASEDAGSSGGTVTFEIDVPRRNVTTATFRTTLQVDSGHVNDDDLVVNVTAPDGTTAEESGSLGGGSSQATVQVELQVATVPTVSSVKAQSESAAIQALAEDHASDAGTGTWTVEVTVEHDGPLYAGSHDLEVATTVGSYAAEVTPSSPEPRGN